MSMRIAIGQLSSSSNHSKNLLKVVSLIERAIKEDVRLIFFPEATDYLSQNAEHSKFLAHKSPRFIEELQGKVKMINKTANRSIDISIGVHLPPNEKDKGDDRVKNVLLYINHEGKILQTYQKLHLFDVDVPNGPILKESRSVQPGSEIPSILSTPVGKLGSSICYDIRFPELALRLRKEGAELICYPSAFTSKTGEAHWELLGRARAIDTQCYVVMPGQCGSHDVFDDEWSKTHSNSTNTVERRSWGHSLIINPWGEVIASADGMDQKDGDLIIADLDMDLLKKVRENMPLIDQRRYDMFNI
ncbi:Deaminated glutathione amidase [Nakaseomyces bracarensis]|uniref:Deaminated glutathione amidase n=1 Tax=Nakaseomyces bracarensis TaxID=273131 RepID=A0ABR4NRB7_9SACH